MYISKNLTCLLIYGVNNSPLHPLNGPGKAWAFNGSSTSSPDNVRGRMIATLIVVIFNMYGALTMCPALGCALCIDYLISTSSQTYEFSSIIIPIEQMRTLRLRQVKYLARGHVAPMQWLWDLNPGLQDSKSPYTRH